LQTIHAVNVDYIHAVKGTIGFFSPQEDAVSNNNKGVGLLRSDELNDGCLWMTANIHFI